MKPSEIEQKETADAVAHVLQTLEVKPGDAAVYADEDAILVATPIGLLKVSDTLTSRVEQAWKMTTEVIPWTEVWPQITIVVERGKRLDGMFTEWTVALGDRAGGIHTTSGAESQSASGIKEFVAAVLRRTDHLRRPEQPSPSRKAADRPQP